MDLLSSLSSRGQPNWLQATVSTILQNLIQTVTLWPFWITFNLPIALPAFCRRSLCIRGSSTSASVVSVEGLD